MALLTKCDRAAAHVQGTAAQVDQIAAEDGVAAAVRADRKIEVHVVEQRRVGVRGEAAEQVERAVLADGEPAAAGGDRVQPSRPATTGPEDRAGRAAVARDARREDAAVEGQLARAGGRAGAAVGDDEHCGAGGRRARVAVGCGECERAAADRLQAARPGEWAVEREAVVVRVDGQVASRCHQRDGHAGGERRRGLQRAAAGVEGRGTRALGQTAHAQQASHEVVGSRRGRRGAAESEVLRRRIDAARLVEDARAGRADLLLGGGQVAAAKTVRAADRRAGGTAQLQQRAGVVRSAHLVQRAGAAGADEVLWPAETKRPAA